MMDLVSSCWLPCIHGGPACQQHSASTQLVLSSFCIHALLSRLASPQSTIFLVNVSLISQRASTLLVDAPTRGESSLAAAIDSLLLNHTLSLASPIFLPSQPTHCAALRSPGLDRSQAPRF